MALVPHAEHPITTANQRSDQELFSCNIFKTVRHSSHHSCITVWFTCDQKFNQYNLECTSTMLHSSVNSPHIASGKVFLGQVAINHIQHASRCSFTHSHKQEKVTPNSEKYTGGQTKISTAGGNGSEVCNCLKVIQHYAEMLVG